MTSPESFQAVAPYYDELMKRVPYRMWVGYYFLLLAQLDSHPETVLDVCCGTGTMTEMLAREGFQMTGIDLSPAMIEEARRKGAARKSKTRYEVGDARDFDLGETFDSALSFFDSLNNILEPEGLQAAFGRVRAHLERGGSFIFDLNTEYAFKEHMFDQENLKAGAKLRYDWKGEYDPASRIIEVRMKFWREGEAFEEIHRQRAYSDEEVRDMLGRAGFGEVRAYASYTLDPLRKRSDRAHYACIAV